MALAEGTHLRNLLHYIISTYFLSLSSIAVVYDKTSDSLVLQEYLDAVESTFKRQFNESTFVGLQWLEVSNISDTDFCLKMLQAADTATEGFITILPNTERFLHARYYATRHTRLRLKDKLYLFLCEDENPKDFLATEILQFYPHHLMIIPRNHSTINEKEHPSDSATPTAPTTSTAPTLTPASLESKESQIKAQSAKNFHLRLLSRVLPLSPYRDIYYELWTQKFVGTLDNRDAVHLDSYLENKTFLKNVELYPNKVQNLKGRTLRLGSITYLPYVVTNYVMAGDGNVDSINTNDGNLSVSYVGSEANLMLTFCQVRNCHLRLAAYGDDNWGSIYDNETGDGMLGDLYMQHVEVAIGCIYNWYDNITETSHTIARSAVTILGPAPLQFPSWRTNIMPFSNHLWTFILITLFICSLVMFTLKVSFFWMKGRKIHYFQMYQQATLSTLATFIQQSSADTKIKQHSNRIFLGIILCATITLESTYSGQLKSILTLPFYMEPVDTMVKWSLSGWKWGAPSIIWIQTVEKSGLATEQILTKHFEIRDYDFLYNASFRNDYGLGIERLMSGYISFGNYITAPALETKLMPKDDLYFDWTRAVSIRGWPLMDLLNKHVRACTETGLFIHWERQMVANYLDSQTQEIMSNLAIGHTPKPPPEKLTVSNISGAIFLLLFGYLISIILFFLEIFGHQLKDKYQKIKQQFLFFKEFTFFGIKVNKF